MNPPPNSNAVPSLSNAQTDALISFRHQLHRAPEISGGEKQTAGLVAADLATTAPDQIVTGIGGHGLAAIWNGTKPGPTVLLRAELDALPIAELPGPEYASQVPGHGHMCGHDGHMTILCAAARHLHQRRPAKGRVILLFQPAEETGQGARAVTADPAFADLAPDYAFALHNLPGVPTGQVQIREGQFNCASRGMHITFTGKTAHASMPETGQSPARAIADFITAAQGLCTGTLGDPDFALTTVTHAHLGEPTFGIAPGDATLMVTLRTATDAAMETLVAAATALAHEMATRDGLDHQVEFHDVFAASINDPDATRAIIAACDTLDMPVTDLDLPFRWSEDFGVFGAHAKSAMFVIGAGSNAPALHNPDYDFPDTLIDPAARIFTQILRDILG